MQTSWQGTCRIATEEAVVLVAYPDGPNYALGVGHNSPDVKATDTITVLDAMVLLRQDLATWEKIVGRLLKHPLRQNAFDALVSFGFNKGSVVRDIIELINLDKTGDAMARLLTYNRSSAGEFRAGLAGRRYREMLMFLNADYGDLSGVKVFAGDPHVTAPTMMPFPKES